MSGQMLKSLPIAVLAGAMIVVGCQRPDNAARGEPMVLPETSVRPLAASPPRPAPTCLVPLADPPPPVATPASDCPVAPAGLPSMPKGTVKFLGASQPTIEVELALTAADQQTGLMYRRELAPESGMLFSWSNESIHTFWMHNTCIPLDMLFITADGTIAGILEQVPVLNDAPRSVPCPAAHVLEVNAGYCRQHGISPGQRVRIKTP